MGNVNCKAELKRPSDPTFSSFPVFRGVVFWQDFVQWRTAQNGLENAGKRLPEGHTETTTDASLPLRAAKILQAA